MRTISSEEYKGLVRGSTIINNITLVRVILGTKRMWGFETNEGFKYKTEVVTHYTAEKENVS
jgi:hypothetical protein